MKMRKPVPVPVPEPSLPQTRSDLQEWIRDRLQLPATQEQGLLDAIDGVFVTHERLWQQSKQEAIQAVSAGFAERMNRMRDELSARTPPMATPANRAQPSMWTPLCSSPRRPQRLWRRHTRTSRCTTQPS